MEKFKVLGKEKKGCIYVYAYVPRQRIFLSVPTELAKVAAAVEETVHLGAIGGIF